MATPKRGEVWLVDLGMVAKIRPGLVLSIPADDENDHVLVTMVGLTTSLRGSRFEIPIPTRFLKPGAFDAKPAYRSKRETHSHARSIDR